MKRLLCFLFTALLMIGACTAVSATTIDAIGDWAAELSDDGSEYTVVSCSAVVSSYSVPAQLNGIPVTGIAPDAFMKNAAMTSLKLREGVTEIGDYACYSCSSLRKTILPQSLTTLGKAVFSGCSALSQINLKDTSVSGIEEYTFANTAITELQLPSTCAYIADNAFLNCGSLRTILIPAGVTEIGESAFDGCDKLTILCAEDSFAAEYAEAYGIPYRFTTLTYPYTKGDADGDGVVSIMDATRIQRYLAKFDVPDSDAVVIRGDVDGNGLNIMDATAIQRKLASMGDPYEIGASITR